MDTIVKEKLLSLINKYNNNTNDNKLDEKTLLYLKKLLNNICGKSNDIIFEVLLCLLQFNIKFFEKYGDEILEYLWKLYDCKTIYLRGSINIIDIINNYKNFSNFSDYIIDFEDINSNTFNLENTLFYIILSQYFQYDAKLLKHLIYNNIFSINKQSVKSKNRKVLESNCQTMEQESLDNKTKNIFDIKFTSNSTISNYIKENKLSSNQIIDIIILMIYSVNDFQMFYTTLSTFLVTTSNSTILLFKIMSLYSIIFFNFKDFNNKDNFLDSFIFVLGSVLRDHAKSYLKSKNRYDETLTYHKCSKEKHDDSDHQYSKPMILSSIECNFLEQNFLGVLINLIFCISYDFNISYYANSLDCLHSSKCKSNIIYYWEDYIDVYYKYIDIKELDVEEEINSSVASNLFINLFLSDFIFFFVSNFTNILTNNISIEFDNNIDSTNNNNNNNKNLQKSKIIKNH